MVTTGNQLGRTIDFPTANLAIGDSEKLIPANGVYAVEVEPLHKSGMMNIGIRPTIGGTRRVIEVNIFDFNEDIYGTQLTIYIRAFLRAEQKFDGLDQLKQQLALDRQRATEALRNRFIE